MVICMQLLNRKPKVTQKQRFTVPLHGSGIQVFDSKHFTVPEDYNSAFPATDSYLCIPTTNDTSTSIIIDVYRNEPIEHTTNLHKAYDGVINTTSKKLDVMTNATQGVCAIPFNFAGLKQVEVWSDVASDPHHIAIIVRDTASNDTLSKVA